MDEIKNEQDVYFLLNVFYITNTLKADIDLLQKH